MTLIDDRTRIIALSLTRSVGWKLIHRLLDQFGSLEAIFAASETELRSVHGIGQQIAANIHATDLCRLADDLERFESQGINVATWRDEFYPPQLLEVEDRPLTLFWKGSILPADQQSVAIVGTREPHPESILIAEKYAIAFAQRGWTVVSGLARGIDSAAHQSALTVGGRSIAVLGCGVNVIYPPENAALAQALEANGALLSEVHPNTAPSPNALMRRNRLITALSRAVIVVEAGINSGALYAARCAHNQGRQVFALNNSAGNANLLQEFAHPLPDDIDTMIEQIDAER
jgi:DNA processing protein